MVDITTTVPGRGEGVGGIYRMTFLVMLHI